MLEHQTAKTNVPSVRESRRASRTQRKEEHTNGGFRRLCVKPEAGPLGGGYHVPSWAWFFSSFGRTAVYSNIFFYRSHFLGKVR